MSKKLSIIPAQSYKLEDLPTILTIEESSQVARVSTQSVRTAIYSGKLKSGRVGRLYRIGREDLIAWLKGGTE